MQEVFLVHTREGEQCVRCGGTIVRIVVAGPATTIATPPAVRATDADTATEDAPSAAETTPTRAGARS